MADDPIRLTPLVVATSDMYLATLEAAVTEAQRRETLDTVAAVLVAAAHVGLAHEQPGFADEMTALAQHLNTCTD